MCCNACLDVKVLNVDTLCQSFAPLYCMCFVVGYPIVYFLYPVGGLPVLIVMRCSVSLDPFTSKVPHGGVPWSSGHILTPSPGLYCIDIHIMYTAYILYSGAAACDNITLR